MVSMTRQIDRLGRIVIPMEIRKQLRWVPGTNLDITGAENGVLITTHQEETLVGRAKKLRELMDPATTSSDVLSAIDNLIDLMETENEC